MTATESTGNIAGVNISTTPAGGLTITVNGRAAHLAIVNEDGNVVTSGASVEREVEAVIVNGFEAFLQGQGFMRVRSDLSNLDDRRSQSEGLGSPSPSFVHPKTKATNARTPARPAPILQRTSQRRNR